MLCRVWYAVVTLCLSLQTSAATLQVYELEDIDMGDVPADMGTIRQSMQFCVAMEPRGPFNLIVRDLAGGPDFSLRSAYVETEIGYQVHLSQRGRGLGRRVRHGRPVRGLRAARPLSDGRCRRERHSLTVLIPGRELGQAEAGIYQGGVSLTVAPE